MSAVCAAHGAPAEKTCERCGTFLCALDVRLLDAHVYCEKCVVLPEVDYLEAYRLQFWGKRRDGFSWFFLLGGATNLLAALGVGSSSLAGHLRGDDLVLAGGLLVLAVVQLAWFFKQRWARPALGLVVALFGVAMLLAVGPFAIVSAAMPGLVVFGAIRNVRSRLFFEIPVPRDELKKDWSTYVDNRLARSSVAMGAIGLVFVPFAVLALILGVVGLRRVDPNAMPPVGNKGWAITGIVLGALGLVTGSLIIWAAQYR
ncbi:MAG: DUF4190 domain-containing protein [Myxococcaceae bacterium]